MCQTPLGLSFPPLEVPSSRRCLVSSVLDLAFGLECLDNRDQKLSDTTVVKFNLHGAAGQSFHLGFKQAKWPLRYQSCSVGKPLSCFAVVNGDSPAVLGHAKLRVERVRVSRGADLDEDCPRH